MNREQAKIILDAGKPLLKLLINEGVDSTLPTAWLANWGAIKAFEAGAHIEVRGVISEHPKFINDVTTYKVIERRISWRNVIENGGLGIKVIRPGVKVRESVFLVGVTAEGLPIIEIEMPPGEEKAPSDVFEEKNIRVSDTKLIKDSWYDEEEK